MSAPVITADLDELPRGRYAVIVADPPWKYQKDPGAKQTVEWRTAGRGGMAERLYPTMTNEEIAALPVGDLAAADAHLFMWITNPGIYGGRFSDLTPKQIAEAWGFAYVTLLTWVKTVGYNRPDRGGMGWYFRGCTEHVLYATRGNAGIPAEVREPNVILAPRGEHSEKPAEFMRMVERVTPGPRLELFSRSPRAGWSAWGNEVDGQRLLAPEPAADQPALDFGEAS